MKLPVGVSDFREVVIEKYQFADKTLLIKEILNDSSKAIVLTRPRRFGKTLNLSMLYYFLQANFPQEANLFDGLAISEDKEFCQLHQNKYPVIFVSFKDVKKQTFDESLADITELMRKLYSEHRYLLEGDLMPDDEKRIFAAILEETASKKDIEGAIEQLSKHLEKKFDRSPIILLDEYDTPIQEAFLRGYYNDMVSSMRAILGKALKDNKHLYKAIITGITRISQESLFSGVNNLEVYSLLREQYGQYFGLTEEEVIKLITQTNQEISLDKIKEWYNGYQVGRYVLYNPWSIINCLKNHGELKAYWLNTSNKELIEKLLRESKSVIKEQFEELLQGNVIEQPISENLVFPEITRREEALWSLLLYAGYLKVLSSELRDYTLMAKLAVPNKEVSFVYAQIVSGWFSDTVSLESYNRFVRSLAAGNLEEFKAYLSAYIMQSGSYFDFNSNTPEQIFHIFILGLVLGLRDNYIIESNRESGLGRFDVAFIPKDKKWNGILLEFKVCETLELLPDKAKEALEQIKLRGYFETFKQHGIESVLAIGLAFCGKQVELAHGTLEVANFAHKSK